jgi:hypothetical protein
MFTTPRKIPGQTDYDEEEHVADLKSPPMESSPSNNRSSRGDEIYEEMYNDFTQMKRQYEVLYQRASSRPTVPRDPIREIMDILDDLIGSLESGIPIFERVITSPTRIGHKCS